ncbi:hypothetical protein CLOM_g4114 [Closterium sp. NIES-68]|nr:hypothetical protein CLOM_g4114 [Closterium sp. NIES-68]GJP62926.1 hypothetical protein CLOP_g19989 [Closterium sp. NIES-67]
MATSAIYPRFATLANDGTPRFCGSPAIPPSHGSSVFVRDACHVIGRRQFRRSCQRGILRPQKWQPSRIVARAKSAESGSENAGDGGNEPIKVEVSPNLSIALGDEVRRLAAGAEGGSEEAGAESGLSLIERNERRRQARRAAAAAAAASDDASIPTSADASAAAAPVDSPSRGGVAAAAAAAAAPAAATPLTASAPAAAFDETRAVIADEAAYVSMVKRAAAATSAWRQAVPFPLSDFFFGPDGVGVKGGKAEEERLIHDIYFKAENGRPLEQVDTQAIRDKVLTSSGFEVESAVNPRQCQQGVVFYGRLSAPAPDVYTTIQARLDASFPGLCAVLARDDIIRPAISVLIAPRQHLLSFSLPRPVFALISSLTLSLSLLILFSSLSVDPALSPTTSPLLTAATVPLGVLLVAAAGAGGRAIAAQQHGVLPALDTPLPLPSPSFGLFGILSPYKGLLPNRTVLLDLSLSSAVASFAASAALILLGLLQSDTLTPDVVTIPASTFAHSHVLSSLASDCAAAVLVTSPDSLQSTVSTGASTVELAVNPLILAGLLGVNLSSLSLLPVGILDGGRIITALFGRKQQHAVSMGLLAAVAVSIVLRPDGRENAAIWLVLAAVLLKRDDWFQREEVSEPSSRRKLVAAALVAASICILWP